MTSWLPSTVAWMVEGRLIDGPVTVRLPFTSAPTCLRSMTTCPPPIETGSNVQLPSHRPVTLTDGGAPIEAPPLAHPATRSTADTARSHRTRFIVWALLRYVI